MPGLRLPQNPALANDGSYLAALDVHRARIFGRCEQRGGIESFDRLVEQVMGRQPYRQAERVFWIIDNGSAHRGKASVKRLTEKWENLVPVHLPVHASWLNQIEIYFSIVQRKALSPNDFASLGEAEERLFGFQERYEAIAQPFEWRFTRKDLESLMKKLDEHSFSLPKAA